MSKTQDTWPRITLRLPPELHERLTQVGEKSSRSLNGEIVARLEQSLENPGRAGATIEVPGLSVKVQGIIRKFAEELGKIEQAERKKR